MLGSSIKLIQLAKKILAGLGNICYCGCCSIRSRDIYSSFPAGDWSCLERNCLWWFQESFTSTMACGEVHEEGKYTLHKKMLCNFSGFMIIVSPFAYITGN